jgi:DNA mismatch repair protein MutS2
MIENTVRQIKEAQAEKEKTKDVRQQLEEFRNNLLNDQDTASTKAEEKIASLESKAKKIKIAPKHRQEKPIAADQPLKPGDTVRMKDTRAAGEIIEVKDKMVMVETGSLRFFVPIDRIERISRSELKKSLRENQSSKGNDLAIVQRSINFKPEIDIRGVRGEEAIAQVRDLVDNAIIVQHRNLRILHGKGNGILRQLVREYLATVDVVKSYRDEHIEFGGSGITVVEMDF